MTGLEKMLQKMDKVTGMNHNKLIYIEIHMWNEKYYNPGDNNPPLSMYASRDFYTFLDASTYIDEVMCFEFEPMDMSSPALTQSPAQDDPSIVS